MTSEGAQQFAGGPHQRRSEGFDDRSDDAGSSAPLLSERNTDGTLGSTIDLPIEQIAADEIVAGTFVGRYRLVKRLGRGGTGEVWQGRDPLLGRFVAVKLIRPDLYVSPELKEGFLREGRRMAELAHPSIVEIFDVGVTNDRPFLVTQFAAGGTLADRIDQGALKPQESAGWIAQVARAAHFAHLQGVVHRDIKPSNILLNEEGQALLGDFGLAISEQEQVHERPSTLGTYAFMSPEQLRGASHVVDGRADIYAIGVTLYLCLTGRLPFLADSPARYRKLALEREPRPLRAVDDSIDAELERICLKCLSREPRDRYTTALDLAEALEEWLSLKRRATRFPRRTATAALLGTAATIAGGVPLWRWTQSDSGVPGSGSAVAGASKEDSSALAFDGELRLLSPSEAGAAAFRVDEDRRILFSSDRDALLRLGQQPGGPSGISVEVVRSTPLGAGGVFWGRRVEERDGNLKICWMSCGIMTVAGTIHKLYVAELSTSAENPQVPAVYTLKRTVAIEGRVSDTTIIDVCDFDRVARILITNGNAVLTVTPEQDPKRPLALNPQGEFGLDCDGAHLRFQKLVYR